MKPRNWINERSQFEERVARGELEPSELICDRSGKTLLAISMLDAFEGDYTVSPYLVLALSLETTGRFSRRGDWGGVDGVLRPGTVALALPGTSASGFTPKAKMLGIAIAPERVADVLADKGGVEALHSAASNLHSDPLLAAVMQALWRDAQVHGLSSAFFDHGLELILNRLVALKPTLEGERVVKPLSKAQLQAALDLIERRIDSDLRVEEIAKLTGRDVRSLTRAFRAATGLTPYRFLTHRRMERAKELLMTESSVLEIAMEVGYANPAKFSAAFRRMCGCSPTDWRKQIN